VQNYLRVYNELLEGIAPTEPISDIAVPELV
jgi:hypothetical protein